MESTSVQMKPGGRSAGRPRVRFAPRVTMGLALTIIVGVLTLSPVAAMFYGAISPGLFTGGSLSLEALRAVYTSSQVWSSLVGTLALAVSVGVLSTVVGGAFAWCLARTTLPAKRTIELIVIAPLFTSPFVAAIAWFALGAPKSGLLNVLASSVMGETVTIVNITSLPGIVWVMVLHYLPYAYLFIVAALRNMDPSLEEASHLNGCGTLATLRRVTLPLVLPSIASAFTFIVILSAGVFSVPAVLGRDLTFVPLPVLLYRAINQFIADYSEAAALGTLLFLVSLVFLFLYRRATRMERRFVTVSGRGFRPREIDLGRWKHLVVFLVVIYGLVGVLLPTLALLFMAFTPYVVRDFSDIPFTLDVVTGILSSSNVQTATLNTVIVVALTAAICPILGLAGAFSARYSGSHVNRILDYLNTMPIAIPGIVLASGMIWIYVRTPLYGTIGILIVAYVTHYLPHAYRPIRNGSLQIDAALEEASFVNGASRLATVRQITTPLLSPAVFSAVVLVVIFTIREVNVAILLYSPNSRVLSVLTWDYISNGSLAAASVVGLMQTLMLVAALIFARVVLRVKVSSSYV